MSKIVQVRDLVKWYGKQVLALNKVSFEVDEGDFFVIIGPSGCGKSTLMKIMAGILDYDSGELYIGGKNMKGVPPHKRDISMMLETYAVFPHMNVFDNVAFGLRMMGKDKEYIERKVKEALELVEMSGFENRSPLELSGGQRQRVALARSLVIEPKVLLLDEPISHVDYMLQRKLMEDFKILHRKLGITFILTTHVQEHALTLADTMMVMNTGVIEQIGKPEEIYRTPKTVFAARFVGDVNLIPGEVASKEGNNYIVKTEIGELKSAAYNGTNLINKKVAYAVRPEFIEVENNSKIYDNKLKGKFTRYYYFGNYVECVFSLKDKIEVKAAVPPEKALNLKLDKEYSLGWRSSDTVLLEKPSMIEGLNIEEVIYGK
ncbi:MAG: ABC transporter ATP-binding protein [Candidatus Bathyarchaeia archaeon]